MIKQKYHIIELAKLGLKTFERDLIKQQEGLPNVHKNKAIALLKKEIADAMQTINYFEEN